MYDHLLISMPDQVFDFKFALSSIGVLSLTLEGAGVFCRKLANAQKYSQLLRLKKYKIQK